MEIVIGTMRLIHKDLSVVVPSIVKDQGNQPIWKLLIMDPIVIYKKNQENPSLMPAIPHANYSLAPPHADGVINLQSHAKRSPPPTTSDRSQ